MTNTSTKKAQFALCFSGQVRTFELVSTNFLQLIQMNAPIDSFFHIGADQHTEKVVEAAETVRVATRSRF